MVFLPPSTRFQAPLVVSPQVTFASAVSSAPAHQHWFTKSKNLRFALVNARLLNIREHIQQQTQERAPTSAWIDRFAALELRFRDFEARCKACNNLKRVLEGRSERKQVEQFQIELDHILDQLEFDATPDTDEGWFGELLGCVWQALTPN